MQGSLAVIPAIIMAAVAAFTANMATAAEQAVAMITRIEPADTGIARVRGHGREDEAAFMMPLYSGDVVTVETPGTVVDVKVFGKDTRSASKGRPLVISEGTESRGMLNSMYAALANKVFRNNQLYRRNLTTRADSGAGPLVISGFSDALRAQHILAGTRSLFVRWNADLDSVHYDLVEQGGSKPVSSGVASGDYVFIDSVRLVEGRRYLLRVRGGDGREAGGTIEAVSSLPLLPESDDALGAAGEALRLLDLASQDQGRWKLEAIQGVVELSPDEIDRATLIDEISQL